MSDSSRCPAPTRTVHCTFAVSAALNRSLASWAFQSRTDTLDDPAVFTTRRVRPRGTSAAQYQPPGMISRCLTWPGSMSGQSSRAGWADRCCAWARNSS